VKDPEQRASGIDLLMHPFVKNTKGPEIMKKSTDEYVTVMRSLPRKYYQANPKANSDGSGKELNSMASTAMGTSKIHGTQQGSALNSTIIDDSQNSTKLNSTMLSGSELSSEELPSSRLPNSSSYMKLEDQISTSVMKTSDKLKKARRKRASMNNLDQLMDTLGTSQIANSNISDEVFKTAIDTMKKELKGEMEKMKQDMLKSMKEEIKNSEERLLQQIMQLMGHSTPKNDVKEAELPTPPPQLPSNPRIVQSPTSSQQQQRLPTPEPEKLKSLGREKRPSRPSSPLSIGKKSPDYLLTPRRENKTSDIGNPGNVTPLDNKRHSLKRAVSPTKLLGSRGLLSSGKKSKTPTREMRDPPKTPPKTPVDSSSLKRGSLRLDTLKRLRPSISGRKVAGALAERVNAYEQLEMSKKTSAPPSVIKKPATVVKTPKKDSTSKKDNTLPQFVHT